MNKDGKITGDDLAKLRAKGAKKEEVQRRNHLLLNLPQNISVICGQRHLNLLKRKKKILKKKEC
jgi:hypothetical protein